MQTLTGISHLDYGHYGIDKLWTWLLRVHDMPIEAPAQREGESCASSPL